MRPVMKALSRFSFCFVTPIATSIYTVQQLKHLLLKYPYCKMPNKIHRAILKQEEKQNPEDQIIAANIVRDAIAFGSLSFPSRSVLQRYYQVLFPSENDSFSSLISQKNIKIGELMFEKHFTQRLSSLDINSNQINSQYYLKIICYLFETNSQGKEKYFDSIVNHHPQNQTSGNLTCLAYILRIKYSVSEQSEAKKKQYLKEVQYFARRFRQPVQKQELLGQKLKTAFILLNIPNPEQSLPQSLLKQCLKTIEQNYKQLDDWQLFEVLSCLFDIDISITSSFLDKITDHIFVMTTNEEQMNVKIPLITKLMNLRHKKKLNNTKIGELIKNNPLKFSSIFFKKNSNKEVFLEVLVKACPHGVLPEEIKLHFNRHISDKFKEFSENQESEFKEVLRTFKMSLKFFDNVHQNVKKEIAEIIQNTILPAYDEYPDVKFWGLIYLFRMDDSMYPKTDFIKSQTVRLLEQLHLKYQKESKTKLQTLDKILDLNYQLARKRIFVRQCIKNLGQYHFGDNSLYSQQKLNFLYYLLLKIESTLLPISAKIRIFCQTRPYLQKSLQTRSRFTSNLKNMMTVANVLYRMEESCDKEGQQTTQSKEEMLKNNIFIWYKLENRIMDLFSKNKSIIPPKQWILLKRYSRNHRLSLKNFSELINASIDHPQNYNDSIQNYNKKLEKKRKNNPRS